MGRCVDLSRCTRNAYAFRYNGLAGLFMNIHPTQSRGRPLTVSLMYKVALKADGISKSMLDCVC